LGLVLFLFIYLFFDDDDDDDEKEEINTRMPSHHVIKIESKTRFLFQINTVQFIRES